MEAIFRKFIPESAIAALTRLIPERILTARRARLREKQWQGFEPRTIKKQFIVEPRDAIFEAGAHHGYTTLLLSYFTGPEGQVHAWEASRNNYEIAARNIQLNGCDNVTLHHAAIGEKESQIHLSPDFNSRVDPKGEGAVVEVTRLDSHIQFRPDFSKIDIEGHEVQALHGAREILANKLKIALEIHTHWLQKYGNRVDEIFELIPANVYDISNPMGKQRATQTLQR